jgi:hypothetical protein
VDFVAIAPFYVTYANGGGGLGFLRVLRLARVMRVFKLGKYSEGSDLFVTTIRLSAPALSLLFFFMMIMMVVFGSLIYFFEQGDFVVTEAYPKGAYLRPVIDGTNREVSPFTSIPLSFYWVIIITTTVG